MGQQGWCTASWHVGHAVAQCPAHNRSSQQSRHRRRLAKRTRLVIAFLDANTVIYKLEGEEPVAGRVRTVLTDLAQSYPGIVACVSRLTWLECRAGPMKSGNSILLKTYDDFFALPDLVWVEITKTVVELAAQIRATSGLKTPDCLQAACCLQLGVDHLFIAGEATLKRITGLNVKLLV